MIIYDKETDTEIDYGEKVLQFLFGDPRPDAEYPLITRMTDEWTDYINYIPFGVGAGLAGKAGAKALKGPITKIANKREVLKKDHIHGTEVDDLKKLKSSSSFKGDKDFVESGSYFTSDKKFASHFGPNLYKGEAKDVVGDKNMWSGAFNKNKSLNTTAKSKIDDDLIKKIKNDISSGKLNKDNTDMLKQFLTKLDDPKATQRYIQNLPESTRQYLIKNGYSTINQTAPLAGGGTKNVVLSLKDEVKVKKIKSLLDKD